MIILLFVITTFSIMDNPYHNFVNFEEKKTNTLCNFIYPTTLCYAAITVIPTEMKILFRTQETIFFFADKARVAPPQRRFLSLESLI